MEQLQKEDIKMILVEVNACVNASLDSIKDTFITGIERIVREIYGGELEVNDNNTTLKTRLKSVPVEHDGKTAHALSVEIENFCCRGKFIEYSIASFPFDSLYRLYCAVDLAAKNKIL